MLFRDKEFFMIALFPVFISIEANLHLIFIISILYYFIKDIRPYSERNIASQSDYMGTLLNFYILFLKEWWLGEILEFPF